MYTLIRRAWLADARINYYRSPTLDELLARLNADFGKPRRLMTCYLNHRFKTNKKTALIARTLSMGESVAFAESKPDEVSPPSSQQPLVKQLTSKEHLDMERADLRNRVATFKGKPTAFSAGPGGILRDHDGEGQGNSNSAEDVIAFGYLKSFGLGGWAVFGWWSCRNIAKRFRTG
jgi:hypothetical protein